MLAVGLHELFWFTVPVRGGGNFDGPRVAAYLEARSADSLREKLVGDGFTHLLIYPQGLRSESKGGDESPKEIERQTTLPLETLRALNELTASAELVSEESGALIYAIR